MKRRQRFHWHNVMKDPFGILDNFGICSTCLFLCTKSCGKSVSIDLLATRRFTKNKVDYTKEI